MKYSILNTCALVSHKHDWQVFSDTSIIDLWCNKYNVKSYLINFFSRIAWKRNNFAGERERGREEENASNVAGGNSIAFLLCACNQCCRNFLRVIYSQEVLIGSRSYVIFQVDIPHSLFKRMSHVKYQKIRSRSYEEACFISYIYILYLLTIYYAARSGIFDVIKLSLVILIHKSGQINNK